MPILFIIFVVGLLLALAIPAGLHQRSWTRFFFALFLAVFGIVIPLFVFFLSALLVPEWKGGSLGGWMGCFMRGKLALTPLVLWACAAWYAVEIYQVSKETRMHSWIVLGYFHGALVSSICCLYLFFLLNAVGVSRLLHEPNLSAFFLLCGGVPFYVAVWYGIRGVELLCAAKLPLRLHAVSLLPAAPLWVGSLVWSKGIYEALPDQPPSCFVVTAASRGHPALVGPFTEITHRGRSRRANRQLATFWQFEERWRQRAPASHTAFRRLYNRLGPVLARRLTRPWLADLAWLALKPAELLARLATRGAR